MTVGTILQDERVNALVGWLAVLATLVIAGWQATVSETLVTGLALCSLLATLLPAGLRRDPFAMLPWELLALLAVLLGLRGAGVAVPLSGYAVVAVLAVVLAVDLDVLTAVEMAPWFTVGFVTVTTMALAALWAIAQYALDHTVGTTYLASNADLMWDLLAATLVGVAAGVLFEAYLRRTGRLDLPSPAAFSSDSTRRDRVPLAASPLRYPVWGMQTALFVVGAYGLVTVNLAVLSNAGVALLVSFVPAVVGKRYDRSPSAGLSVWITAAAFLHAVGLLGPYGSVAGYDHVTHALSASLVAGVGYAIVKTLDHHATDVSFPPRFRVIAVVLFVLAAGVCWELIEFGAGGLATLVGNGPVLVQYGLGDTVFDLVFDAVGAFVVALWGTRYFDDVADFISLSLRVADGKTR